jgi:hypothetical protein
MEEYWNKCLLQSEGLYWVQLAQYIFRRQKYTFISDSGVEWFVDLVDIIKFRRKYLPYAVS